MKLIIPMAGMGKRMRPHTLTIPKPLIKVAGKSIVQRLVEDITSIVKEDIEEIAFIIGDFGELVEQELLAIATGLGTKGKIYYQHEALGTGHAIHCARESLDTNAVVAFADTLFSANFSLNTDVDGIIWVKQVEDPRQFGVVKLNGDSVTDFVEKPQEFVSDLAIIGIYYFKNATKLRDELDYLIDNNITTSGEYQLTDALENLKNKGYKFGYGAVDQWLDCGNVPATVNANKNVLNNSGNTVSEDVTLENSVIVPPCYVGKKVTLKNAVIGPNVSIEANCTIENSVISNSIVNDNSHLKNISLSDSLIGNNAIVNGTQKILDIGDFSKVSM